MGLIMYILSTLEFPTHDLNFHISLRAGFELHAGPLCYGDTVEL